MQLLICIDDTDNLESKGTGWIASEMLQMIETKGWGKGGFVTRHQLILHPDVPYTSHNSSMCFNTEIEGQYYDELKLQLAEYLETASAAGSDPGICIADQDNINHREKLIEFGLRAKCEVLTKDQAYRLAAETGIFLEEKGGSGDGVIGALAGVGLRMNGNDGEVKGGIKHLEKGMRLTVAELLKEELVTAVCTMDMKLLADQEIVTIKWKAKPVMHNARPVLLVVPGAADGSWLTMDKNEMRQFDGERSSMEACSNFIPDAPEEMVNEKKSCFNCIYRRWTENSFICTLADRRKKK